MITLQILMSKKILLILILGIIYKLIMTSGGNFIFQIDSARDMIDVREMVVLGKPRLTGPNTSIEGVFNGPLWYYLLSVPFIVSGGHPYSPVILQIIFWAVGGYFLLKIVSKWSNLLVIPIGLLWVASDYINLTTVYAFNPSPIALLTPLFIFLAYKYIETNKLIFAILTFLMGGLFFNLEMNFGIFIPLIIFCSILFSKRIYLLRSTQFWVGAALFLICLLPQIIFDLRHQFLITKSFNAHLQREVKPINFSNRIIDVATSFYNTFKPTILNRKLLSQLLIIFSIPVLIKFLKQNKKNTIVIICLCYIFIPFIAFLFLPVTINPWHLGGPMAASIILVGFIINNLWGFNLFGKMISLTLTLIIIFFSLFNIFKFFLHDINITNQDPSLFKNEISAIDYIYKYADGKNFKVYVYLPSVYDYPYQYLFWWYGKTQYGYIPEEYAYSPNKPQYISNKERFSENVLGLDSPGLVFLIKEPDRIQMRQAWENDFKDMEFISKEMVGPLEIEIRKEVI